jgi:hypothetical protein
MSRKLHVKAGPPLTAGPTVSAEPDHVRMCAVMCVHGLFYMYADYVPADNPYAPGTFNTGLHLFTSADLIDWTHRGPILGPSPSGPDSYGCVNVDVLCWQGRYYLYYLGLTGPREQEVYPGLKTAAPRGWLEGPASPYYLEPTLMVAEADSPEGPFSNRTPVLHSAAEGAWDSWKLVDPHVCVKNGRFLLYYKGFDSEDFTSRKIGLATGDSPTGPFHRHLENPVVDLAPETGCEVPTVFCHHGRLGMLLLTFSPRRSMLLFSEDGVRWTVAQDPFSPRTGHAHTDIGLVKDTDNNLLPYYFQMNRTTPMTIKGYHLEVCD